jgi:AraC-like DNA-binding protein
MLKESSVSSAVAAGITPLSQAPGAMLHGGSWSSEIGLRIGCADQSHFTALFRTHVALTPQAYRNHIRRV